MRICRHEKTGFSPGVGIGMGMGVGVGVGGVDVCGGDEGCRGVGELDDPTGRVPLYTNIVE